MRNIHQRCYTAVFFLYQILLYQTVSSFPSTQAVKTYSTKIQLGIGDHVDIRCSDFSPTHRDGDLFWVKASSQSNPIRRGKCTDCIAYTVANEDDKISIVKQEDDKTPEFLPNRNRQLPGNGNHRKVSPSAERTSGDGVNTPRSLPSINQRLGNSSTLHLTVYQDDDFGTYYCKQRTGTGLRDNKNLLDIQITPKDESKFFCGIQNIFDANSM